MSFRACLVIPVYNHGDAIGATIATLRVHGLPLYLVDDGSDAATARQLDILTVDDESIRLLRLPRNAGKGAAVMRGLRAAWADGFTHALQIDADGQHDAGDIPKFLAHARANPAALVCGQPIFDASVPTARHLGRYITHVWVWIETLSFAIKDSMCGFRLYPLALASRVIETGDVPARMDFDPAIAVRLAWAGAPIINVATRVTYPAGGISHFDMWRDNLRISRTHARLVVGMLWRLPLLLGRKVAALGRPVATHWARVAERGSYAGMLVVFFCYRMLGPAVARLLLYPITAYFFLTHRQARRCSRDYLRRLHAYVGPTPTLPHPPSNRDVWRHLLAFAESTLDKVAAWTGRHVPSVDFPNRDELDKLIHSGRGALLIGAHLGNWEMSRALAHFGGYRGINAVVYTEHARRFNRLLKRANADVTVNLIPVSTIGPDTAILLQERIDRGELLVIVGDRTPPGDGGRVVNASFLGAEAPFAQGPYIIAALLGCPVYLFFCLREGERYRIYLEPFAPRLRLPRSEREQALRQWAQRYAQRLEHYCVQAPHQWFNFYDFWANATVASTLSSSSSDPVALEHAKSGRT